MKSLQALLAAFACAILPLHAADVSDLTYTTTDGEVTITNCDEAASGELVIPPAIEGNSVTSISTDTFRDCTNLTSITLPNSVTSIGSGAFQSCTSLASITLPDSVTSISTDTFYLCTSLTSITLPNSVTSIGFGAFEDCTSLTSITLSDSVTSIGSRAFRDCNTLQSVYFLGAPPTVGSTAFLNAAAGAKAIVPIQFIEDFGGNGAVWSGLVVEENEVLANPGEFGLVTQEAYETLVAAYTAAIAERDARPTAEQLAAVEAERDARFTEDQIRAMSADYTIGLNAAGNVQMKFNLFESTDLNTFAPFTVTPESVSVVDGSICFEFAPTDDAAFFRFSVQ